MDETKDKAAVPDPSTKKKPATQVSGEPDSRDIPQPLTIHDFAARLICRVVRGEIDMAAARTAMHQFWQKVRTGEDVNPRELAVEYRRTLERVSLIAGELHTEFLVASAGDR